MNIRIYTMTHKAFEVPQDKMYTPLQVGSAVHEDLGYLRDDEGENISPLNCYYSELTGLYWVWKNIKDLDYVGTCHYRRYLINDKEYVFTKGEYEALLKEYDLITTRKVHLNNSYHYGFAANHNIVALDTTGEVIKEKYPEYYDTFIELVNGPDTYFGNMFVTSKALYDEYCSWLFSIFFEVQKRIDLETDKDEYHRRVFGFISEFLLYVWVSVKKLKVCECKVGMLGEKAETREMKEQIARYLKAKDISGAKQYFLTKHAIRPDVMMEASDITGELHLAMQIIATADMENRTYGRTILDDENDFRKLIDIFTKLNSAINNFLQKRQTNSDIDIIKQPMLSDIAVRIAVTILPVDEQTKQELIECIFKKCASKHTN